MTDTSSAADARRAQIVRAARETCLDTGFSKLTISGIAERAGMTRSLFYHYFPDKNAVADAVIDDTINRAIIADEGPFSARLMQAGNAELYIRFIDRIADRIADYICNTTALDFERMHGLPIHSVHETMYVLIVGLISMIRLHPDTPDNVIKRVAAQILHIEEYVK